MANAMEQLTKALEETAPASSEKTEEQGEVSTPVAQTSTEAPATGDTKAAEAKAYQQWQSRFDAQQARIDKLEAETKARERAQAKAKEDKDIDAEYSRYIDEGEDETKVLSLKAKAQELRDKARKHNESVESLTQREQALAALQDTINAREALFAANAPASIFAEAVPYLIEHGKGSPKTMQELAYRAIDKFKKLEADEPQAEDKPKRPDASYHSAPGGGNVESLSPMGKVTRALAQKRK